MECGPLRVHYYSAQDVHLDRSYVDAVHRTATPPMTRSKIVAKYRRHIELAGSASPVLGRASYHAVMPARAELCTIADRENCCRGARR